MDIALDVIQLKQEGKGLREIRIWIDDKYTKLGYTPTDTPFPEE